MIYNDLNLKQKFGEKMATPQLTDLKPFVTDWVYQLLNDNFNNEIDDLLREEGVLRVHKNGGIKYSVSLICCRDKSDKIERVFIRVISVNRMKIWTKSKDEDKKNRYISFQEQQQRPKPLKLEGFENGNSTEDSADFISLRGYLEECDRAAANDPQLNFNVFSDDDIILSLDIFSKRYNADYKELLPSSIRKREESQPKKRAAGGIALLLIISFIAYKAIQKYRTPKPKVDAAPLPVGVRDCL